jgi:hypothetical protein
MSSAWGVETETPLQVYKDLLDDAKLAMESYAIDQIWYKKAIAKEAAEKARAQSATGAGSSHGDEYCRSAAPLYSSLHTLRTHNYHTEQGLKKLPSIADQDVFAAHNAQLGSLACQDYRAENIQQLKATLLREFSQACEALESCLKASEKPFITRAEEQEIKDKTQDCLELFGRIEDFADYGLKGHQLANYRINTTK